MKAVIARLRLGGKKSYLQKLCCELLDLGKYELCCRYLEGAPTLVFTVQQFEPTVHWN